MTNETNIIFDMDGTLIDSAKIAIPAFEKVCPGYGLEMPKDEVIKAAVGYANPFFYYKIYPDIDKKILIGFAKEVEAAERKIVEDINKGMLFEGVKDLLEDLSKRGHKMYIASTGDFEHVDDCLRACELHPFFEKIHCNKPDKELMVANIIKNKPVKNWVMVGDRKKDSKAAKYNQILSVGAAYGYCEVEDYKEFDMIIYRPGELIEILNCL